jgi:integrase
MSVLYDTERRLKSSERRIENSNFSERDKNLLFSYEADLFVDGLGECRVLKYLDQLYRLRLWLDTDFELAKENALKILVGYIQRRDVSASTKRDYKICLRKFFRWLYNDDSALNWIKIKSKVNESKIPEELLTEEEILRLIEVADHPRDKAIIATLYDTGGRIGEIGTLKIKHINFDEYGAQLVLNGKTGMRRVRAVFCVPYLSSWLDIHPDRENPDSYVWIGVGSMGKGKPLRYAAFRALLGRLKKKAGIKKRIYNHLFRHSRCTELAQHLSESQLEGHVGWVPGSDMSSVYVHLSGKQIDDAILSLYGIKKSETNSYACPLKCPRCGTNNGATSERCKRCGLSLKEDIVTTSESMPDDVSDKLIQLLGDDPELKNLLFEYIVRRESM